MNMRHNVLHIPWMVFLGDQDIKMFLRNFNFSAAHDGKLHKQVPHPTGALPSAEQPHNTRQA